MPESPALDRTSRVPLYEQLAQFIESDVSNGVLRPGDRLEDEVSLAARLQLSRPTVRRAIHQLVDRGLLVRKRGVGTQVVNGRVSRPLEHFSLHDDLLDGAKQPTTRVLVNRVVPAADEVAARLLVPTRSPVVQLRRLRMADGSPLAILSNHLPQALIEPTSTSLQETGLYTLLRGAGVAVKVARQQIGARLGTDEECRLLHEPANSTVLTVDRLGLNELGRPVEWGRHVYRASRYSLSVTLT